MYRIDLKDLLSGLLLMAIGLASVAQSLQYSIGTIRQMGPGFFPLAISILLTFMGVCVLLPSLFRQGEKIEVHYKDLLVVLAAVIIFGLTIKTIGIFGAIIATVIVAGIPGHISFLGSILLGVSLSILCCLVFVVGLGMTIPLWPWSV